MTQTRPDAHRLEIVEGNEHVRIVLDGVELADSRRPVLLREGSLPTRYYLPRDDVRLELLTRTETSSHCPFKGDATYWSAVGVADIAWTYAAPVPGAERITGLVCFFNEKVDIEIDGAVLERPKTQWS